MNALASQTSPYLLQHADNPVDWYPWGEEALQRAMDEDRPILLSIGYSACHWCHVMAHESFEDEATAALMNDLYINIKVDREERPDIDRIYQTAHAMLTRNNGGWPLTMFLTPHDRMPFFGGTYFPRESRYGLPGFKDLLRYIAEVYRDHREDITEQNASLRRAMSAMQELPAARDQTLDQTPLAQARHELAAGFDSRMGGFGGAPKFPHPGAVERLLRQHAARADGDAEALQMACFTLERMAMGGIYDHLGGGFCRYSVDARWMIPHFEKMLYDNGPLLQLYAEAWLLTGQPLFRRIASGTAAWLLGEMRAPDGGFYSSLDADSEGEEGKFYVWERSEVEAALSTEEYRVFAELYGLTREANFEGKWHLYCRCSLADCASTLGIDESRAAALLGSASEKLLERRARRVRPGCDDKVLVSWNALAVKGLACAGRILEEPSLVDAAQQAVDFIRGTMWHQHRLYATYKDGRAHLNAYLDDYAFLIDAILHLLEARWRREDLAFALELAEVLLTQFEDREAGGFFFTSHDHETLIQRSKTFSDDALPAGNGVAACALQRLDHLLGEPRYGQAAERTLRAGWEAMRGMPSAHNTLLRALEEHLSPPQTILLRGSEAELRQWQSHATRRYAPNRLTLAIPSAAGELPGLMNERKPRGEIVAYVCHGHQCDAPITDLGEFQAALEAH